jgi:VanZ family protein
MLIPGDSVPNLGFFGWDKVAHLAVFAVLGVLTGAAFVGRSRMALTVLLYGTFLGGVTEAIQTFAPGRIPSIFDVAANVAGTILGLVLVQVLVARRSP